MKTNKADYETVFYLRAAPLWLWMKHCFNNRPSPHLLLLLPSHDNGIGGFTETFQKAGALQLSLIISIVILLEIGCLENIQQQTD